eukprot:1160059-Pelagomonas_calceolata.AAC.7
MTKAEVHEWAINSKLRSQLSPKEVLSLTKRPSLSSSREKNKIKGGQECCNNCEQCSLLDKEAFLTKVFSPCGKKVPHFSAGQTGALTWLSAQPDYTQIASSLCPHFTGVDQNVPAAICKVLLQQSSQDVRKNLQDSEYRVRVVGLVSLAGGVQSYCWVNQDNVCVPFTKVRSAVTGHGRSSKGYFWPCY